MLLRVERCGEGSAFAQRVGLGGDGGIVEHAEDHALGEFARQRDAALEAIAVAIGQDAAEIEATLARYQDLRRRIDAGEEQGWTGIADFFTDDCVYIDPAWGRIEGIAELRTFLDESMRGLEDWKFPVEYVAIEGDTVVIKWTQVSPGTREDGSAYEQSGYSTLVYAGDGKFSYEEDLLNMTHVLELVERQRADDLHDCAQIYVSVGGQPVLVQASDDLEADVAPATEDERASHGRGGR